MKRQVHDHGHPVDVVEGHHSEHPLAFAQMEALFGLANVGHQVAVRQHHAFRHAGGAARVGQRHQVLRRVDVDGEFISRVRAELAERCGTRSIAEDENLFDGRVFHGFGRPIHEGGHCQQEAGTGILQLIGQLARGVQRVDGGDNAAQRGDGEERDRVLDQVGAENGEHVSLPEPAVP